MIMDVDNKSNENTITRPEGRELFLVSELACVDAGLDVLGEDLGILAVDGHTD